MILGNPLLICSGKSGGGSGDLSAFSYTGSFEWKDTEHTVLALTSSGALTFQNDITVQAFLVGGGAGGYNVNGYSGGPGGGGGYTKTIQIILKGGTAYPVTIGAGGAANTAGGATSAFDTSVSGGKTATKDYYGYGIGGDGGSGGGGSSGYSTTSTDAATLRGGNGGSNGGNGSYGGNDSRRAGGKGQGLTTRAFGDPDGELYAGGGSGGGGYWYDSDGSYSGYGQPGTAGAGGGGTGANPRNKIPAQNGQASTGGGGGGASVSVTTPGQGGSGVILLRLPPKTA